MSTEDGFRRRAARAGELSKETAAELLRFAAVLFAAQGRLAASVEALHALEPLSGDLPRDLPRLLPSLRPFLESASKNAPAELVEEAGKRAAEPPEAAGARLTTYWEEARSDDFLSRAFLRPYVEAVTALGLTVPRRRLPGHCPRCGGAPVLSIRRPEPESEAGRRFLLCSLCGGDWPFGRIKCPACSEEDPDRLPTFQTERHPGVRVEACETCRRYVKSIDLTIDARPVPEVDDLVSVAVDLWAQEEGFTRIEPGAAGI